MGEVYEAYDADKGRTVALKILADEYSHDENFRTRFQRESRAAAILQEPHVIPIHDWGEIDGSSTSTCGWWRGRRFTDCWSRARWHRTRGRHHRSGRGGTRCRTRRRPVHRDIKPQNIIVTPADFAYLVDFGIAETTGDTRLTAAGTRSAPRTTWRPNGSPTKPATSAVDVYSLACVLYEALTGETVRRLTAWRSGRGPHRLAAAAAERGQSAVPAAFDAVIARGMAKDPDDRYGTAGGLGRAAQRALDSGQPTVTAAMPTAATILTQPGLRDPEYGTCCPTEKWVRPGLHRRGRGTGTRRYRCFDSRSGTERFEYGRCSSASSNGAPIVTGTDQSKLHQSCDQGFALPARDGFGTHAGRGTPKRPASSPTAC